MTKTCFVITGYGIKKDYIKNRDIDLDKTFRHIIQPVFAELGYECKRSCDYPPAMIDSIMYKGIFNADFVLADISTLNPNAMYELGVRHALRPYTTLVICEDRMFKDNNCPFDLSHLSMLFYRHDGVLLDIDEVARFRQVLKEKVMQMLTARHIDSPVHTYLSGLQVMLKTEALVENIAANQLPTGNENQSPFSVVDKEAAVYKANGTPTLAEMIDTAKTAMNNEQYEVAIAGFKELLNITPGDTHFILQLCRAVYKSNLPDPLTASNEAYRILLQLNPDTSICNETLGMAGNIHKNLYRLTNDKLYLEKGLRFYERGYYVGNDYYNGINTAFLYWIMASVANDKEQTRFFAMQAEKIDRRVIEICNSIMEGKYEKRTDREWIINALAEAYFGLNDTHNFERIAEQRKKEQTTGSQQSFNRQLATLTAIKQQVDGILASH